MDASIVQLVAALAISIILTGVLIPKILLISFRKNLFDVPDERKIHKSVVPRLGGIAFMPAIFFTIAAMVGLNRVIPEAGMVAETFTFEPAAICAGMCAVMVIYLVGIADDLIGVKYRAKFVTQLMAAFFLVGSGLWIRNLDGFLGIYEMPPVAGITLTVVVIVFIMNAINLIDGIDGLASGLSAIALTLYTCMFYHAGMMIYALACVAALGTLAPFFYYNVFGDPKVFKKIFMGDTGSLTTGLILAYMALHVAGIPEGGGYIARDSFVAAFSPLIIPCFDVLRVFGNRLLINRRNPFIADRTHIHHKLLDCGLPQRAAMVVIVVFSAVLTGVNILLATTVNITLLVAVDLFLVLGFNSMLNAIARRRNESAAKETPLTSKS